MSIRAFSVFATLTLLLSCVHLSACARSSGVQDKPENYLVNGLTGDGTGSTVAYDKPWYAGFLKIKSAPDDLSEKLPYFWFFPAQVLDDAHKLPFVVWLSGGPGCSSLYAALTQNGPFIFQEPDRNTPNDYSWNTNAHVLYLESPPGVGFSKTDKTEYNDTLVAEINLYALDAFFQIFTDYRVNPLYLAGEQYAGVYIPQAAKAIIDYNTDSESSLYQINLKGVIIGNGITSIDELPSFTTPYMKYVYQYYYNVGLISDDIYEGITSNCANAQKATPECVKFINAANDALQDVNQYNVDQVCEKDSPNAQSGARLLPNDAGLTPCVDTSYVSAFLNQDAVRAQILDSDTDKTVWSACNAEILENYLPSKGSYDMYQYLIDAKLRVLVYSGDRDATVPITGTLSWIGQLRKDLKLNDLVPYTPWYYTLEEGARKQNGGDYWTMDYITFIRLKGCGHMVQWDNPKGVSMMIYNFLYGLPMDISPK